ncbi:N-acetyltransferase [Mycolicibacterium anyangense]|uniref:N-acetyltransferase n=1 Tax=Mycolicibacterium anyangense TaxID=1431246 RepID=A0A6N4W5Q9_9MYCO|nr:GNAT family N-acetyltransferase [Mycolicibacterium anyangense]BBZ75703.1 N-acetyltransferase [Mycolicibacterium anyangense]
MPTARVTRLTESDWEQFAALRLRALADAFGTADEQYLAESQMTPGNWRQRLRDHAQFVAFVTDRPAGLIAAHQEDPGTVYLYSLWLDPRVRGRGLGRQLVAAALDWARRGGARVVTLRMARDNNIARAVYESFGFTEVADDGRAEVAMVLRVG